MFTETKKNAKTHAHQALHKDAQPSLSQPVGTTFALLPISRQAKDTEQGGGAYASGGGSGYCVLCWEIAQGNGKGWGW